MQESSNLGPQAERTAAFACRHSPQSADSGGVYEFLTNRRGIGAARLDARRGGAWKNGGSKRPEILGRGERRQPMPETQKGVEKSADNCCVLVQGGQVVTGSKRRPSR